MIAKKITFAVALGISLVNANALAATLTAGEVAASPGQAGVALPLALSSEQGENVAGIQVDVSFNDSALLLETIEPGEAAVQAGKEVVFNALDEGTIRIIIAGFNQDAIPDGVVAYARFTVDEQAPDGAYPLTLEGLLMAGPFGDPIPSEGVSGRITVGETLAADLNEDFTVNALDVQLAINGALGLNIAPYEADVNDYGKTDAVDVQLVINAALGLI